MLVLTTLTLLTSALAAAVTKLPSYHLNDTHLNIQPFRWHAPPEMGNITLSGHHHEIASQIAALKPLWHTNATYLSHLVNTTAAAAGLTLEQWHADPNSTHDPRPAGLEKRSNRVAYYCFQPQWAPANYYTIKNGYEYILNKYGNGLCEAPPHSCARMACSYDNSINMCNDQNTPAIIPCSTLAQNARFLDATCLHGNPWIVPAAEGQSFFVNPSYNVLIKHTDPGREC